MMNKNKEIQWMELALKEAEKAYQLGEVPIGAVVIRDDDNEILATACNQVETTHDATAHAEMLAIQKACQALKSWRLHNCALYVTLEPCPMCAGAILQSRIDKLVFGASDPKAWGGLSIDQLVQNSELNHQVEVVSGLQSEKSRELMQSFFQALRAKPRS